jgi:hypothetical protein
VPEAANGSAMPQQITPDYKDGVPVEIRIIKYNPERISI